jgi:hypothetical protein
MRHRPLLLWMMVGLASAAAGWLLAGPAGSFVPRIILATAGAAAVGGRLASSWRHALVAGLATALVSGAACWVGRHYATPLLAFPAAALSIGVLAASLLRRRVAQVVLVVVSPLLGGLGFVAGVVLVVITGMRFDDGRLLARLLLGGAAVFGFSTLGGVALVARWLDRTAVVDAQSLRPEVSA